MSSNVFLFILFLPFIFSIYLMIKKLCLSPVNKKVLNYGLLTISIVSLFAFLIRQFFSYDLSNIFLIAENIVFIFLCIFSFLYFQYKKKFIFKKTRYNIFLSLLFFLTNIFIYSSNIAFSLLAWILSGVLIYIFSYFDIFKTDIDFNPNRFYSIFLVGDFCFLLVGLLLLKYALIGESYSYLINYSDVKSILSYILANNYYEYLIVPFCFMVAIFSRCFIFPFSCFFSFLNVSTLLYFAVYSIIAPLYSIVLFLKMDLFESVPIYFKIYLLVSIFIVLFSLLFENKIKIIFGYLFSIINTIFILVYFYNKKISVLVLAGLYSIVFLTGFKLFLENKSSFKKRLINLNKGFFQERLIIFIFEKLPNIFSFAIEFIDKKIFRTLTFLIQYLINVLCYYYMVFIQKRRIFTIVRGVLLIYAIFVFLALFIALFGNFGEIGS